MTYRLFVLSGLIAVALAYHHQGNKVLLRDVSTLVFRSGETAHRARSADVPAMKCTSGDSRRDALPGTITCRNTGWDGDSVTWDCSAELPQGVWLRNADVICEGWSGPGDGYVRTGSCSIEYELDDRRNYYQSHHGRLEHRSTPSSQDQDLILVIQVLFLGPFVLFFIFYLCFLIKECIVRNSAPPAAATVAVDGHFPLDSRRHRRGDVDISAAHVYHHHDDTDCTGARRVNHFHHGSATPAASSWSAPATSSTWSAPPASRERTPSPRRKHTSTVGAKTRDSDTSSWSWSNPSPSPSTHTSTNDNTSWVTPTADSGTHTSTTGAKSKSI